MVKKIQKKFAIKIKIKFVIVIKIKTDINLMDNITYSQHVKLDKCVRVYFKN